MKITKTKIIFITYVLILINRNLWSQTPIPNMPVIDGKVYSIVGNATDLYIGGYFSYIGQPNGSMILADATTTDIDANFPVTNGSIYTIINDGSSGWFIGGNFTEISGVFRKNIAHILFDYSVDTDFSPDPNFWVKSLALSGSYLYIGGDFVNIDGHPIERLAKIDVNTGAVDVAFAPNPDNEITSLVVSGTDLLVGGRFTNIDGQNINKLAKIDAATGVADAAFAPDPNGNVTDMVLSGTDVFAIGSFTAIGGQSFSYLSKLDVTTGVVDVAFAPNPNQSVDAIALSGSDLYVGGWFSNIGGQLMNKLAKLSTTTGNADASFIPALDYINGSVVCLAISGNDLFIAGTSSYTQNPGFKNIYKVNKVNIVSATTDNTFQLYSNGKIRSLFSSGNNLVVGGECSSIGGIHRENLVKVDMATGVPDVAFQADIHVDGNVNALLISGSELIIGGQFQSTAGNPSFNNLVKTNILTGALDIGFDTNIGDVRTLALSGSNLLVGEHNQNVPLSKVNIIDGTEDTAFPPSFDIGNNSIYTLIVSNGYL